MKTDRFSRQITFLPHGEADQRVLKNSRVAILGVGALGSHMAEFAVRAGIGYVRIIDADVVEESNLQRQTLYSERDLGRKKVEVAAEKLSEIYSDAEIEPHQCRLDLENGADLIANVDLVLDGTDSFSSRFVLNKICAEHDQPWIHTGVTAGVGQCLPIFPGKSPCLRCLLPDGDSDEVLNGFPSVATHGILGTVVAGLAGISSTLAIKILLGLEVEKNLIFFDLWKLRLQRVQIEKDPNCPVCAALTE